MKTKVDKGMAGSKKTTFLWMALTTAQGSICEITGARLRF